MSFLSEATSAINGRLTPTASGKNPRKTQTIYLFFKKKLNTQESVLWLEKLTYRPGKLNTSSGLMQF